MQTLLVPRDHNKLRRSARQRSTRPGRGSAGADCGGGCCSVTGSKFGIGVPQMPHAVQGSGATGHAAATINGLYVPLGHLVANQAYSSILDNLDDDQDLTFAMIQQACDRKLRRGQDRGDDCRPDQPAMQRCPATPHREHKDILRPKDFTHSKPGDVTAFLCNFLVDRCIKPKRVLTPLPKTCVTLLPFKLRTRSLSPTCLNLLLLTPTLPPLILHVILRRRLTLMLVLESSFCLCRSVQGLFFILSPLVSVLPLLLTWRACTWRARHSQPPLRYQTSAISEISKPKVD